MRPPRVYTLAPGVPFVDALAAGLRARLGAAPEALATARIFLPTRRACRALSLAFVRQAGERPILLPRMTPLGDVDEDDLAFDEAEASGIGGGYGFDLPPAISRLRRHLLLTQLVTEALGGASRPAQAAHLAGELARLFDQVHTERLDLRDLGRLVPDDLARHWQVTLAFLQPLASRWQAMLDTEGCIDPALHRDRLLSAQAAAWRMHPPSTPVIAAGSTGSQPATADLLKVIASLPAGAVVLPGLDTYADEDVWRAIDVGPDEPDFALAQTHPQFGLAALLRRFGITREDVRPWPAPGIGDVDLGRAELIRRALAPAACSERAFAAPPIAPAACDGIAAIEAASPEEEARSIALIMRQTLEAPGRTAALVTPDRLLARRVGAALDRWGIAIDDSGGQPLSETGPATFLRLIARMVVERFAPVPLLAALKHPLAACGQAPTLFRRHVRDLEHHALRGLRPAPGMDGLRQAITPVSDPDRADSPAVADDLAHLLDALDAATQPFARLRDCGAVSLAEIVAAHVATAEALGATDRIPGSKRLWRSDAGEALAGFISELAHAARHDPLVALAEYPDLLDVLMGGCVVRPRWGRHPRLAIWGPLEARLQRADVMILGSLNEESWPPKAHPSPWMSRPMMQDFGLPLPERRIGLSAHDFAQCLAAPEVWLTRARRREGAPTVPCRWLLRLQTLLRDSAWMRNNAETARSLLHWQRQLDEPAAIVPGKAPAPTPPGEARPRRLSVTQVETWIRDPYAIYARHILKLRPLKPIDASPEAADFGTCVHTAIRRFLEDKPNFARDDDEERLLVCGRDAFGELMQRPGVRAFWWRRFERIARWIVNTERTRRDAVAASGVEIDGAIELATPGGAFLLVAKADRIDRLTDGTLSVIDYKTGEPPSEKDVLAGLAPQLPLEAAIAEAGGFTGMRPGPVAALEYWRLRGDDKDGVKRIKAIDTLADDALSGLRELIACFDDPRTPYASRPRPHLAPHFDDYAHLARVKEWAGGGDEADE
ncbi:MAG: double-strand break repair protein AddB [Rhodospirillales bacterium]|nr:double-strand break repair protein AddB [Rhodospirillales bacterium]